MDPHENYSSSSSSTNEEDDHVTEQLQTLQSMIQPNTIGDGRRSILEETHEYLQRIHEETERIEKELSQRSDINNNNNNNNNARRLSSSSSVGQSSTTDDPVNQQGPKILSIEVEELIEGRYVVKMSWSRRRGSSSIGGSGHVQRVIDECCSDVNMTSTIVNDNNPDLMFTTAFVKVNEETKTEDELHDLLMNAASRFGLLS